MPNYKSKYKGSQIDGLLDFVNDNKNNIAMQSDIPTVPSKTSDLNNDSNFIDNTVNNLVNYYLKTETYTQSEINALVSAAASGGFVKVNELPTEDINIKAIYLVPYTGSRTKNLYEEYIYIDGDWEMIGTTKIDLSNYITTEALSTALADYVLTTDLNTLIANYYNKTEIAGLLSNKVDTSTIGQANGVASLDNNGKVPSSQLPEQGGGVSDFNDLTNRPQKEVTSIASLIDPVPLPTHNQVGSVGFTPVGTVISVMGTTAPRHYLACNGQVVNISNYPELADYFEEQFGTKNKFGGDGTTTFGIPDLRGEFLRGTGTNGHANQGNGEAVGVHQDATNHPWIGVQSQTTTPVINFRVDTQRGENVPTSSDKLIHLGSGSIKNARQNQTVTINDTGGIENYYASRPTNTSVLYCIASKNIYLDARFDYSLEEKVVGTWIDGKPIYQKTFQFTDFSSPTGTSDTDKSFKFPHNISNPERYLHLEGYLRQNNAVQTCRLIPSLLVFTSHSSDFANAKKNSVYACVSDYGIETGIGLNLLANVSEVCITLQYTKTTD